MGWKAPLSTPAVVDQDFHTQGSQPAQSRTGMLFSPAYFNAESFSNVSISAGSFVPIHSPPTSFLSPFHCFIRHFSPPSFSSLFTFCSYLLPLGSFFFCSFIFLFSPFFFLIFFFFF